MRELVLSFSALADPTRLRLLHLMKDGEICVCYLQGVLQTNQPKISRHLAYLRKAGLVGARRDGKWMHYRIKKQKPGVQRILTEALAAVAKEPQGRNDLKRLDEIRCCPARYGFSSPFDAEK
jgi:ArsR family transcriptional regulator, arsenate/arsenite/antimonite-responsive transcriptional repressor